MPYIWFGLIASNWKPKLLRPLKTSAWACSPSILWEKMYSVLPFVDIREAMEKITANRYNEWNEPVYDDEYILLFHYL